MEEGSTVDAQPLGEISLTLSFDPLLTGSDRILAGMMLIRLYEPNADIAANHDIIYFGDYETTRDAMSPVQQQLMHDWGWFEDADSWAHYV